MSIERLFSHRAVAYRPLAPDDPRARGEMGNVVELYEPAGTAPPGLNCWPDQAWAGTLQDRGPGEREGSLRRWFLHRDFDVRARDVLEVETGENAPVRVRIQSVTPETHPHRLHHIEVNVDVYDGDLDMVVGS